MLYVTVFILWGIAFITSDYEMWSNNIPIDYALGLCDEVGRYK